MMKGILETRGNRQVDVHYVVSPGVPGVVEENFEGYYLGNDDLFLEVLQDQETVYQSLQLSGGSNRAKASTSTGSELRRESSREGESSEANEVESQLKLDEALALSLQELENHLGTTSLDETSRVETVNREVNTANSSVEEAREDNIDPDNMTYEQLQSLGETIGTESRGLSDELIAYLPSFKYKIGFFSKKEKHDECVICCEEYKNRDVITTLPCQHQYHSKCVTRWLKLNKACPVCNEEVFGS